MLGSGPCSLAYELRLLAEDLVGLVDRDELTPDEERHLADLIEESVTTILPRVTQLLEGELEPRVESMPLHARVVLAGARRRRQLGLE